jgi:thiol-disulfide isomerase/thioredoxin
MRIIHRYILLLFVMVVGYLPDLQSAEIKPGATSPNCTLTPIGGGPGKAIQQYQGKVVYIDFWASWCGPCAQSFPFMNKLYKDLHAKGLEVVGVNLDEEPQDALGFLAKTPAQFTILADASGQCPQDFGVKAMPSSYLIDRTGVVRHVHLGFKAAESAELRQQVEALLEKPAQ